VHNLPRGPVPELGVVNGLQGVLRGTKSSLLLITTAAACHVDDPFAPEPPRALAASPPPRPLFPLPHAATHAASQGYYCPYGASTYYGCPAGYYCPYGSGTYYGCPSGKYQNSLRQTGCKSCPGVRVVVV